MRIRQRLRLAGQRCLAGNRLRAKSLESSIANGDKTVTPAEDLCEDLDAAIFSGNAFISHAGLKTLREYLERWNKYAEESIGLEDNPPSGEPR